MLARTVILISILLPMLPAQPEPSLVPAGPAPWVLPPAVDAAGAKTVFASTLSPGGKYGFALDIYSALTSGAAVSRLKEFPPGEVVNGATAISITADGALIAYTAGEQVHLLTPATGEDRLLAVNKEPCAHILVYCPTCIFTCTGSPNIALDGSKVVYSATGNNPFWVVNADGTGLRNLKVYSGALAASPQRVLSRDGSLVFSSSAPAGPTFAASAENVYLTDLDGANFKPLTQFGNNPAVYGREASLSADGGIIVFESNYDPGSPGKPGPSQIWTVRADAGGLMRLTSGADAATEPSLSADGKLVAFVRAGQVWVTATSGGEPRALTSLAYSTAHDPAISGDGSRVVFAVGPPKGRSAAVYTVKTDGTGFHAVYAPNAISPGGILNAAGDAAPSAGSLISVYGTNLGVEFATASGFPLPETLAGVALTVNGKAAPLLAVTPSQVNAQVPPDLPPGTAIFELRLASGVSVSATADIARTAPAVFGSPGPGGEMRAASVHGGLGILVDETHPARPGETIEVYGTGLGPTSPAVAAGEPAPSATLARVVDPLRVLIGDLEAKVVFAGLTPGLAGVYQLNVVVPEGLPAGQHLMTIRTGDTVSIAPGRIWVRAR